MFHAGSAYSSRCLISSQASLFLGIGQTPGGLDHCNAAAQFLAMQDHFDLASGKLLLDQSAGLQATGPLSHTMTVPAP
jgi:hypothetical protein